MTIATVTPFLRYACRPLASAFLGAVVTTFSAQSPTAACSIPTIPGGQSASAPAVVSGIQHVPLKFAVHSNGRLLADLWAGAAGQSSPTVRIAVWRIDKKRRDRAAYELEQTGGGQEGSTFDASLALRIPVDDERRARDIRKYLDWVETEGTDRRNADAIARLKDQREAAIIAMESIYLQNRPGLYAVECEYTSTAFGTWQGTARARTLYLRVRDDDRYFDQPGFKAKAR